MGRQPTIRQRTHLRWTVTYVFCVWPFVGNTVFGPLSLTKGYFIPVNGPQQKYKMWLLMPTQRFDLCANVALKM